MSLDEILAPMPALSRTLGSLLSVHVFWFSPCVQWVFVEYALFSSADD